MTSVRFSTRDVIFSFGLDVPLETPAANVFQVAVLSYSNNTADSNTQVAGLPIPADRLHSTADMVAEGFESMEWLNAWAQAAHASGAFGFGFAQAFGVANTSISVGSVEVQPLDPGEGRRLASEVLRARLTVAYSIGLRLDAADPNHPDRLLAISDAPSFAADVLQQ